MAINKKLIHFQTASNFEAQLAAGNILDTSICFIKDAKKIWTHGQYYDCNGGNETSDSPTFLRIGDADDEAKANFIAVANRKKTADYYICASNVQGAPVNGVVTKLYEVGPSSNPGIIGYTFYGAPTGGQFFGILLKITTELTVSTGVITTTYEAVLDAKQDVITDLEDIRDGAAKGATAVQPSDITKEIYLADFTMTSLRQGMNNGNMVHCNMNSLIEAMAANKIILVREDEEGSGYNGVYVLNGYAEDLLYFSITDTGGDVLWCEGTDYTNSNYIDGKTLHVRRWDDKQDILVSGKSIKTINGESIVGSGDITVATISDVNTAIANAITNVINASY